MYKKLEAINKNEHKNKGVEEIKDFSYAKELINAPIAVSEFFEACKNYPIFFAKDKDKKWFASILLGYKEGENIFVDEKGVWKELHYIPAFVRSYPFILVNQEKKEELILAVDSEYLSEKKDAKKLFDEKGENSEFLNSVLTFLNQFHADSPSTAKFVKQLEDLELLEEKSATITKSEDEKYNLNGFFIVNEQKLRDLSEDKKKEICLQNLYPLITAHLISLSNIQKIGTIK